MKGFTIIQTLLALAILAILSAVILASLSSLSQKSSLEKNATEAANILRLARSKSVSSENNSQYGVYFSAGSFTLFKGPSYASRDASFDDLFTLSRASVEEINLGGSSEVAFSKVKGEPSAFGDIKIGDGTNLFAIYIEKDGKISFSQAALGTADSLTKDSRRAYFDLGWSMQNAAALKLYYPSDFQTKLVDMALYFNSDRTEFDWQESFQISGQEQELRIHSYFFDSLAFPYSKISVTRDRNHGKNGKELIIYIIDNGIEKEIAHYFAAGSVAKGQDAAAMEIR